MIKKKGAKRLVGVWIDHREALVVVATREGAETRKVTSNAERQLRRSGQPLHEVSLERHENQKTPPEDVQDRAYEQRLARYYDEIVAIIGAADSVYLMGPGEAKGELNKRLVEEPHAGRVITVDAADKLTEPQVVRKVRQFFFPPAAKPVGSGSELGPTSRH